MAGPFDRAMRQYGLPQYGINPALTSPQRREDPSQARLRSALEGGGAPTVDENGFTEEDWAAAQSTGDPFGVMEAVRQLREERESENFLGSIAKLNPQDAGYTGQLREALITNPRAATSPEAMRLLQFQRQLIPDQKDYSTQFKDPLYRSSYQNRVKSGVAPEQAYNETLNEAANEEMAIKLIESGVPAEKHGELMTGGVFDRRKVAQMIADQGKELPRTELNELLKLASDYQKSYADPVTWAEPSAREKGGEYDVAARDWFRRTHEGQEPSTPQDWEAAYYGMRDERIKNPLQAWQQRLGAIEGQYRIPEQIRGLVGGATRPVQAPTPTIPAAQQPSAALPPTTEEVVVEEQQTPPPAPTADRSQLDKLWTDYMDLQGALNVDSKSTNPADMDADREIRQEMAPIRQNLMKSLGLKDDDEGKMRFEELFRNRQKSGFKDYSNLWR